MLSVHSVHRPLRSISPILLLLSILLDKYLKLFSITGQAIETLWILCGIQGTESDFIIKLKGLSLKFTKPIWFGKQQLPKVSKTQNLECHKMPHPNLLFEILLPKSYISSAVPQQNNRYLSHQKKKDQRQLLL